MAKVVADGAAICSVNFSEVVARLSGKGTPVSIIHEALDFLGLEVVNFDTELAYQTRIFRIML